MKRILFLLSVFILNVAVFAGLPAKAAMAANAEMTFTNGKVELLSGRYQDGVWQAAVQITLEEGWKTYWKVPGDSGIPPHFDWSGSQNITTVNIGWPAPKRFHDASGEVIGYKNEVVFPLRVKTTSPDDVAQLSLQIMIGVCRNICIPVNGNLAIKLDPAQGAGIDSDTIATAVQNLPQEGKAAIELGPLTAIKHNGKIGLKAVIPGAGAKTDILIEGPSALYFLPPISLGNDQFFIEAVATQSLQELSGQNLTLTILSSQGDIVRKRVVE